MKIYINQDEIEFSLESESNLGEIIQSVEKWLSDQSFSITELYLDDKELFLNQQDSWGTINIDEYEKLQVTALTLPQLKIQNLETILNYCQMLQISIKEGNTALLNDLLQEYSYIEASYEILLEDFSGSIKNHMAEVLEQNGFIPSADRTEEQVKIVLESFMMLEAVVQGRLDEIKFPEKAGKDCYEAIVGLMPQMEEVSLCLQTGKDKEAMDTIIRFTELFQKLLRIFTFLSPDTKETHHEDLKIFINDMSGILKELTDAFTSEDSVLMGDLMEYEILPRMKSFPRYFESISS